LGAQLADRFAVDIGELAAERDVGALLGFVLGLDEHERREVGELAVTDGVGAQPRIVVTRIRSKSS
jgi:hypothetical protein